MLNPLTSVSTRSEGANRGSPNGFDKLAYAAGSNAYVEIRGDAPMLQPPFSRNDIIADAWSSSTLRAEKKSSYCQRPFIEAKTLNCSNIVPGVPYHVYRFEMLGWT